MRTTNHWTARTLTARAGALALAVGLVLGTGASGATAVEPADRPMLRTSEVRSAMPLANERTVTLQPTAVESATVGRIGSRGATSQVRDAPSVGWIQHEDPGLLGSDTVWVEETAVKFDMSALGANEDDVTRAVLRFDERAKRWTSGSGAQQHKDGCVAHLGIATTDWADQPITALFPNRHYSSAPDGAGRAWSVKDHVKAQLASPGNTSLHHGFVLQGGMDLNDLGGDDNTSCSSYVSNIRLEITLDVDDRAAPQPAPKPAAPPQPAPPTQPDLMVTRVTGPTDVFVGASAVYEVVLANDGTAAQGTSQITINAVGGLDPVELVETPNGFTCDDHPLGGFTCTGSLGGVADPVQERVAIFKLQVRGNESGQASVYGLANHDGTLDEMPAGPGIGRQNVYLIEVTVK